MSSYSSYSELMKKVIPEFTQNFLMWARFCKAGSDVERFRVLDTSYLAPLRVEVTPDPDGKSPSKAESARARGNQLFATDMLDEALNAYNESTRYSPWPSADVRSSEGLCLALAFGNRSAVLSRMGRHAECVADVDRAISFGYPKDKIEKLVVRKAKSLIAAGCFGDAVNCMESQFFAGKPSSTKGAGDKEQMAVSSEVEKLLQEAKNGAKKQTSGKVPTMKPRFATLKETQAACAGYNLKDGCHEAFNAASSALELSCDDYLGRYFVAFEDIVPGDVLLKEPSFVHALGKDYMATNCMACTMWTDTPIPCKGCTKVIFCSQECSKGDMGRLHAKECDFLWMLWDAAETPEIQERMTCVMRTYLTKGVKEWRKFASSFLANCEGEADGIDGIPDHEKYPSDDYNNVFCLVKGVKRLGSEEAVNDCFRAFFIWKLVESGYLGTRFSESTRDHLGGLALRHMANYQLNTDHMFDWPVSASKDSTKDGRLPTGKAIHPTLELFNHSCEGNVTEARFGNVVVLRACREIKKGEPVVRSMNFCQYLRVPVGIRQQATQKKFGYVCQCQPCVEGWAKADPMTGMRFTANCLKPKCGKGDVMINEDMELYYCMECGWNGKGQFEKVRRWNPDVRSTEETFAYAKQAIQFLGRSNLYIAEFDAHLRNSWAAEGNKRHFPAAPAKKNNARRFDGVSRGPESAAFGAMLRFRAMPPDEAMAYAEREGILL